MLWKRKDCGYLVGEICPQIIVKRELVVVVAQREIGREIVQTEGACHTGDGMSIGHGASLIRSHHWDRSILCLQQAQLKGKSL